MKTIYYAPNIPWVKIARPGRNQKCHCGSEKKYKNCHLVEDKEAEKKEMEQESFDALTSYINSGFGASR